MILVSMKYNNVVIQLRDISFIILLIAGFVDTLLFNLEGSKLPLYKIITFNSLSLLLVIFSFIQIILLLKIKNLIWLFLMALGAIAALYSSYDARFIHILLMMIILISYDNKVFNLLNIEQIRLAMNFLFTAAVIYSLILTFYSSPEWSIIPGYSSIQGITLGEVFSFRVSIFTNSLMKGVFFCIFIFLINLFSKKKNYLIIYLSLFFIVFSFSRTAYLIMIFVLLNYFLYNKIKYKIGFNLTIIIIAFAVIFFPVLLSQLDIFSNQNNISNILLKDDSEDSIRSLMYFFLIESIVENFPFGDADFVTNIEGLNYSETAILTNIAFYGILGLVYLIFILKFLFSNNIVNLTFFFTTFFIYCFYSSNYVTYGLTFLVTLLLLKLRESHYVADNFPNLSSKY